MNRIRIGLFTGILCIIISSVCFAGEITRDINGFTKFAENNKGYTHYIKVYAENTINYNGTALITIDNYMYWNPALGYDYRYKTDIFYDFNKGLILAVDYDHQNVIDTMFNNQRHLKARSLHYVLNNDKDFKRVMFVKDNLLNK